MRSVDLNADLGEGYGPWRMGDDEAMLGIVASANIACGGHAGDPETMFRTLSLACQRGITVGAHPSYPDKENFGRRRLLCEPAEIERFLAAQVGALAAVSTLAGARVKYVKPHGALGNLATVDRPVCEAIVRSVKVVDPGLAMLAISGTLLEHVARDAGMVVFSEVFADRGYTSKGNLVPRGQSGAMIVDPFEATDRMMRFLNSGRMPTADGDEVELKVDSICIHGDSAHAIEMARHLRSALDRGGFTVSPFIAPA
jgi:UPF0271 protein